MGSKLLLKHVERRSRNGGEFMAHKDAATTRVHHLHVILLLLLLLQTFNYSMGAGSLPYFSFANKASRGPNYYGRQDHFLGATAFKKKWQKRAA